MTIDEVIAPLAPKFESLRKICDFCDRCMCVDYYHNQINGSPFCNCEHCQGKGYTILSFNKVNMDALMVECDEHDMGDFNIARLAMPPKRWQCRLITLASGVGGIKEYSTTPLEALIWAIYEAMKETG